MAVINVVKNPSRPWLVARATGALHIDDILTFLRTVRASPANRPLPLLFDARGCTTTMSGKDIDTAVSVVQEVVQKQGPRGPVALIADDSILRAWCITYGTRCATVGVAVIRTFDTIEPAEQWLASWAQSRRERRAAKRQVH